MYPLAARLNMKMKLPPIQPRSRRAHEAAKWAENQNCFKKYNEALFRAFFEDGLDIGENEVLEKIAAKLNRDPENLARALDSNEYTKQVVADQEEARQIGINAVQAYVMQGKILATGIQSAERLSTLCKTIVF